MIMNVRFFLSYDILKAILSPSKFVYFNETCIVEMDVAMFRPIVLCNVWS